MCFLENYPEIATVNIFIYFLPGYLSIYIFVHMFEQIWNHTEFLKYIKLQEYLICEIIQSKLKIITLYPAYTQYISLSNNKHSQHD